MVGLFSGAPGDRKPRETGPGKASAFGGEDELEKMRKLTAEKTALQMAYEDFLNNSLLRISTAANTFAANFLTSVSDGFGNAFAAIVTGAQTASEAFSSFGKQLLGMMAKIAAQMVINSILAAVLQKSVSAATLLAISPIAGAWAAAATAAAIATLGSATLAGNTVIPMMTLNAGLARALTLTGGVLHGGLDRVPREGTFLLDQGERVVQRQANRDLTEFLRGARNTVVQVLLDGSVLAEGIGNMSQDGRLTINARAVV
jgi:hypothetical protein